ncbi:DNA recombination protein RmuC [Entomobacter blattae]|uniref:DNA recombination protein RmuC homolog n=1 Tax=Entomobacter blattae TaxID=2762277 RepID=A0A7H1NNH7_9PROT|nr:DNA recombination protein RmuC [Entomobacter blattae]QNT77337.1 RmuC family protein [Entomobacter blattae]
MREEFALGLLIVQIFLLFLLCFGFFLLWRKVSQSNEAQPEKEQWNKLFQILHYEAEYSTRRSEQLLNTLAATERALTGHLGRLKTEIMEKSTDASAALLKEQAEARIMQVTALKEMAENSAKQLHEIRASVSERLHEAVEKQMQTSFSRVLEQFASVQKAMGEVSSMTAQIGDLKRLFSNVKTRGGWGEAQLRSILDDILPPDGFLINQKLDETSGVFVEFALYMPANTQNKPLLAIDSKFPTESYERLLDALEVGDGEAERKARRELESTVRSEAKKIASKYIVPPVTVDFAILYLPTDGLYAEVSRMAGLIDELNRSHRILVMSPALMPAFLRTIQIGHVSLAMEEKTQMVAALLGATRQEMIKMDGILEKLAKNTVTMGNSIEAARTRTRWFAKKLRNVATQEQNIATPEQEEDMTSQSLLIQEE